MERAKLMGCLQAGCLYSGPAAVLCIIGWIVDVAIGFGGFIFYILASLVTGAIGYMYRKKMVEKYQLPWEGDAMEFCCWWCCDCCSVIQEYRVMQANVNMEGTWVSAAAPAGQTVVAMAPGQPAVQAMPVGGDETAKVEDPNIATAGQAAGQQAPPEYAPPGLPEGWTEYADESGRAYFHNAATNETTYDRPGVTPVQGNRACC
jgi:Cys-rich protein (TIGR01571 family)